MAAPPIITVGDVSDADCDFNDLQTAIDSINVTSDIHVTNTISTISGIELIDKKIRYLKGGYASCASVTQQLHQNHSISNNDGTNAALYIKITDASIVSTMNISGFNLHDSVYGLSLNTGGSDNELEVNIEFSNFYDNTKSGLNMLGTVNGSGLIVNIDDSTFHNNLNLVGGSTQGGGIRCIDTNLTIGSNVAIYENQSDNGAGVYAVRCQIAMTAGGYFANGTYEFGVFNNAASFGGGFYLYQSNLTATGSYYYPVIISNNSANNNNLSKGGGIYYTNNSSVTLSNAHVNNNSVKFTGSAIYGRDSVNGLKIKRDVNGCQYDFLNNQGVCSEIKNNAAISATSSSSALYIFNSNAEINQVHLANNQSSHSLIYATGNTNISFEGNLVENNTSINNNPSATLITLDNGAGFYSAYNTYTGNDVSTVFDVKYSNNTPDYLNLYKEIIANAPATIIDMNGGENDHDVYLECSIIHDASYGLISGTTDTQVALPDFIGNSDYRLQFDSVAINKVCSIPVPPLLSTRDIRGYDRNTDGQADAGAYEINASDDVIFKNSFEGVL